MKWIHVKEVQGMPAITPIMKQRLTIPGEFRIDSLTSGTS